jgi:hypothetical protein
MQGQNLAQVKAKPQKLSKKHKKGCKNILQKLFDVLV